MAPAVEIEDVFRVYATEEGTAAALQGLSLTVQEGEVVAVLGPSGSARRRCSGSWRGSIDPRRDGFASPASTCVACAGAGLTATAADSWAMRISGTRRRSLPS